MRSILSCARPAGVTITAPASSCSVLLGRLSRLLFAGRFATLIIGFLILTVLAAGRVVGLLARLPALPTLDLTGVPIELGGGDQDAARDLLGLEGTAAHGVLHGGLGKPQLVRGFGRRVIAGDRHVVLLTCAGGPAPQRAWRRPDCR